MVPGMVQGWFREHPHTATTLKRLHWPSECMVPGMVQGWFREHPHTATTPKRFTGRANAWLQGWFRDGSKNTHIRLQRLNAFTGRADAWFQGWFALAGRANAWLQGWLRAQHGSGHASSMAPREAVAIGTKMLVAVCCCLLPQVDGREGHAASGPRQPRDCARFPIRRPFRVTGVS